MFQIRTPVLLCAETGVASAMEMMRTLTEEAAGLAHKARTYSSFQHCFDDAESHMHSLNMEDVAQIVRAEIADIECDLTLRKTLWAAQEEWRTLLREWRNRPLHSVDTESMQRNVSRWMHVISVLEKGNGIYFKLSHLELRTPHGLWVRKITVLDLNRFAYSQRLAISGWRGSTGA